MLELKRALAARLQDMRVRIEIPDANTVLFRSIPLSPSFFNKVRANLLIKRQQEGMPFLVCVDADLAYRGADPTLSRAFAGPQKEGWRVLSPGSMPGLDFEQAVDQGLSALGFERPEPGLALPGPAGGGNPAQTALLKGFGRDLFKDVDEDVAEVTVGREREIENAASCLLRWGQARLPLVVGPSGVGKTNMLEGLARYLRGCPRARVSAFVRVDLADRACGGALRAVRPGSPSRPPADLPCS